MAQVSLPDLRTLSFALAVVLTPATSVLAADAEQPAAAAPVLTPEEQAEKDHRDQCKMKICQVFADKKADGAALTCDVVKTWHKDEIEKRYLREAVAWPWGNARCKADIKLDTAMLISAAGSGDAETKLEKHVIACDMMQKDGTEKYGVSFSIAPIVSWKDGQAVKVVLNMADIDGAALAQGGLWTIAKFNDYLGVLDKPVVEKINEFVTKDCKELLAKK